MLKRVFDNRYVYAQYLALAASVMSLPGWCLVLGRSNTVVMLLGALLFCLGLLLAVCAYCLGGLLTAIKAALSIAKWGWLVVPFPYDLATGPIAFFVAMIVFFLFPIVPVRKAYKENM